MLQLYGRIKEKRILKRPVALVIVAEPWQVTRHQRVPTPERLAGSRRSPAIHGICMCSFPAIHGSSLSMLYTGRNGMVLGHGIPWFNYIGGIEKNKQMHVVNYTEDIRSINTTPAPENMTHCVRFYT